MGAIRPLVHILAATPALGGHVHDATIGEGPVIAGSAVADGSITTAKLADDAVTGAKLVDAIFAAAQFQNLLKNGDMESWSAGTSSAPDGWVLSGAGASVAREATTVKRGTYSAALTRAGTDCALRVNTAHVQAGGTSYIDGREFTLGFWVWASVASRARIGIGDGVSTTYGSYHSGGSAWEWLTVTKTMDAASTELVVLLAVDTGDTSGYFDAGTLVEGSFVVAFGPHPNDEHAKFVAFQDGADGTPEDFVYGKVEIQSGQTNLQGDGAASVSTTDTITFATAFRKILGAICIQSIQTTGQQCVCFWVQSISTTQVSFQGRTTDGAVIPNGAAIDPYWIARGIT